MEQKKLYLYQLDMKYIRDLAQKDDNVRSVSPQIGKASRPFVGVIIICADKKYCVPLSSPKPKHDQMKNGPDLTKIYDKEKLIGVLNFNNMIPVDESVIHKVDLNVKRTDNPSEVHYKKMTSKQLDWCQNNQDAIVKKANKLYRIVTETPKRYGNLVRRCCDFKKLESVLEKRLAKENKQDLTSDKNFEISIKTIQMEKKQKDIREPSQPTKPVSNISKNGKRDGIGD